MDSSSIEIRTSPRRANEPDPVTTQVVRHALNSAANQMKHTLMRTAFTAIVYEVLDFAVAIYDREVRMLAQAPAKPLFMGTLGFCIQAGLDAVGGPEELEPGDLLLYNIPYGTGSHAQDVAVIMPVFYEESFLVGYAAIKAHVLDLGGKDPYSTDTIDIHQEGTFFPGIKLYRRGTLVDDVAKMIRANSRVPEMVIGDINAEVAGVRVGGAALLKVVEKWGPESFFEIVERIFDHGEAVVRSYLEKIPDGRYVGQGEIDNDGVDDESIPFEVVVEVEGSDVQVDYSRVPDARRGPMNCPRPNTVSASRVAISMLAGAGEPPNEGHFRPIKVVTRPGSMFEPRPPSPCFLANWPALQAIEVIYHAISKAVPDAVPASSGGDICALVWWGTRQETGEPWADGSPHPVGQGAHREGDGASSLIHVAEAATRFSPVEVWEAKNPWLLEKVELAPDSGGAGRFRGGLGVDMFFRMLEDTWVTSIVERTRNAPWGLAGGLPGRPNSAVLRRSNGTCVPISKVTRLELKKGDTVELYSGGGGGFGDPNERDPAAVQHDVREGYVSEAEARSRYPHAFEGPR